MSSYELMVFLEFMPDDSAFKLALRGGEYSEDQITWRHIANEIARLRATIHIVNGGQRYEPPVLMSQAERAEKAEDMEATAERREDIFSFADRPAFPANIEPAFDDEFAGV